MNKIIPVFFIALGVILGGSFIGSIGSTLAGEPPLKAMSDIAGEIKPYAIICAIGGTFANLRLLEGGFLRGEVRIIIQQFLMLIAAFTGAQLGYWLIISFCGGR